MPIDYSKFDNILDEDDDDGEDAANTGGLGSSADFEQLLQQCFQNLDGRPNGDASPAVSPPAIAPSDDDDFLSSRSLDWEALREEAWRVLCTRLVVRASDASTLPRTLLLEAEMHMIASRYRQALVASLALQIATTPSGGPGGPDCLQLGGRFGGREQESSENCWATPAAVIEMVSCYQLGDRERALELRNSLRKILPHQQSKPATACSGFFQSEVQISHHLQRRFEGTSEVLELVPELMGLLRAAETNQADGPESRSEW